MAWPGGRDSTVDQSKGGIVGAVLPTPLEGVATRQTAVRARAWAGRAAVLEDEMRVWGRPDFIAVACGPSGLRNCAGESEVTSAPVQLDAVATTRQSDDTLYLMSSNPVLRCGLTNFSMDAPGREGTMQNYPVACAERNGRKNPVSLEFCGQKRGLWSLPCARRWAEGRRPHALRITSTRMAEHSAAAIGSDAHDKTKTGLINAIETRVRPDVRPERADPRHRAANGSTHPEEQPSRIK